MKYPCGCKAPWRSAEEADPGESCPLHSEWGSIAYMVQAVIATVKASPEIRDDDYNRRQALQALRQALDLVDSFSEPEEPEPPDRETEIEDGEYRPCP